MVGWGGERVPSSPSVVSGPGAGSARTDGSVLSPSSPAYGDAVDLQNIKAGAPMGGPGGAAQAAGPVPVDTSGVTAMNAPSTMPDVPVTAGANAGAGPGQEALGIPQAGPARNKADAAALGPALQAMIFAAGQPDATPSFRALVRQVVSNL